MNAAFPAQQGQVASARTNGTIRTVIATADIRSAPSDDAPATFRARPGDRVSVIGSESGFAVLDVAGAVGYMRPGALGDASISPELPRQVASNPQRPTAAADRAHREHAGSKLVSLGLSIFAWVVFIGGNLVALIAATNFDCESAFERSCSSGGATQFAIFLAIAVPSTLVALLSWAVAYAVLILASMNDKLLAQMEERT